MGAYQCFEKCAAGETHLLNIKYTIITETLISYSHYIYKVVAETLAVSRQPMTKSNCAILAPLQCMGALEKV